MKSGDLVKIWLGVLFENSIVCHVFYAMGPGGLRVLCGFLGLVLFWFAWLLLWGLGGAMWSGFLGCVLTGTFLVLLVLFGEFDPGSGRTLAACLTHASRTVKGPAFVGPG